MVFAERYARSRASAREVAILHHSQNCESRRRELITAYTRRSGFYSINHCILSVYNAPPAAFIQSRPNAPRRPAKGTPKTLFISRHAEAVEQYSRHCRQCEKQHTQHKTHSKYSIPRDPQHPAPLRYITDQGKHRLLFSFAGASKIPRRNGGTAERSDQRPRPPARACFSAAAYSGDLSKWT